MSGNKVIIFKLNTSLFNISSLLRFYKFIVFKSFITNKIKTYLQFYTLYK